MKSISKVLSMILVVVMCFGLFTTSAFATAMANFDFSGSGNNAAQSNTAGGGFDFNPAGSSNSASNGSGGFDFGGQQSQPVSFDPQPATTTTTTTNTTSGSTATTTNSLSTGDSTTFGASGPASTDWTFNANPTSITKSAKDADATVTIKSTNHENDFGINSFPGGYGYNTVSSSTSNQITSMSQNVSYSITDNKLTIFGSWLKQQDPGVYYFFGVLPSGTRVFLASVAVNLGQVGNVTINNSPYNKNSSTAIAISASGDGMKEFIGFKIVGVTDPSFSQTLGFSDYTKYDTGNIRINASVLNSLPDGEYALVGSLTPGMYDVTEKTLGNFQVVSGSLGVDYTIRTGPDGSYDKSKPLSSTNYISAEANDDISAEWLYKFTYKVTNPSGTYVHNMQQGEYAISKWGGNDAFGFAEAYLNSLPDGKYTLIGIATVGSGTVEKTLGSFTVTNSGLAIGEFVIYNNAYDKSKSDRAEVYAQTTDAATIALMPAASYAISGPQSKTLTKDTEYYVDSSNGFVALKTAFLDTLPDGTYTLTATFTSGAVTVQKTLGNFTVSTGDINNVFTIGNNPYDKNAEKRSAIVALAGGSHPKAAVDNVIGVAITGPVSKTLSYDSDYYKVTKDQYFVAIRPEVLDTLPDGVYNFILTINSGAATAQITAGQFTVKSSAVDSDFSIANSPYDKNDIDSKAVGAVPKTTGVVASITGVAISGPETRTLTSSEYYKQADKDGKPGYVVILKDVLDKLPDGTYNFLVTIASGTSSVQKNVGQFVVKSGTIDFGEFEIMGSPYDKDADHDDPAAIAAVAKKTGVLNNLSDYAISGVGSINPPRVLKTGEYYTQGDTFAIDNKVLDALDDGSYYIVATAKVGTSSQQVTLGIFNVTSGGVDYGFQINNSPYDKNKADDLRYPVWATAKNDAGSKAKGIMKRMSGFAIATGGTFSTGTYSNIRTLSPSEYEVNDSNNSVTISKSVLDSLADGNYVLLGSLTTGNVTQQLTIGGFTIVSGDVNFGTTFIYETVYDKNDKDRKAVYGGVKDADTRLKLSAFSITGVSDSSYSQALSVNQYTYTDGTEKKIELSKDVLDALPDGIYNLMCTAAIGPASKSISLGSFTIKSGNVNYGTPHIGNPLFDKNDEKRQIVYAWVTDADVRFEMSDFVIAGITYPSINQKLSGGQYSMEGKTKVNLTIDILDALPDGDYNLLCTATVDKNKIQMTLGKFSVISGKVDYGTYVIYGSPYDKNASPAKEFYAQATAADKMTKMTGFAITGITNPSFNKVLSGSEYARNEWSVTISEKVLKALPDGDYNLIGFATVANTSGQVNIGKFTVVSNYGDFHVYNSPYNKNEKNPAAVYVTAEKYADMQKMGGFGVASVTGSYVQQLSVNSYYRSGDGKSVVLEPKYLDTLEDGQYYIVGFPTLGSTAEQVILGTFVVRSGGIAGNALLTPDGQVWYGGSDPLTFYSEIHDLAGKGWNYKPYDWGNIVPDIRVSTYSDMRSPTSVRIDQYWDLNYGYIMLGANFLNSLSAEHTYYMQVIDARDPEGLYSNVVSFRVGPTLRALDTDKHVINSTRSLRFRCSEPVARVYVGNIELTDPADFGVSWDGRTVTLSFEFLNKRTGGNTYTIKVLTTGGEYASTTFQVLTTAQGSASPRTGDESNLGLWAAFLLLSGTAVVVLVPKLKKHDF